MSALSVCIGAVEVGVLESFEDESQQFTFSNDYSDDELAVRPVLGQIFEDRYPNPISVGGPICWFGHLLPQGVMRQWRSKLLDIDQDDVFGLLQHLGNDLPGAVVLHPTDSLLGKPKNYSTTMADHAVDVSDFQFSLAGAQWKLSARSSGRGLTTKANSAGKSYIAKFHSPNYPGLPQCEFATMTWAKESGLIIPDFEIRNIQDFDNVPEEMPTGDGLVFVIERFDRSVNDRIHMEDFGQILDRPPGTHQTHGAYEELANVIRWIAPDSIQEFLKQIVFNIICGNGDAHLKNFSVIYPDSRNAVLSPAYDIVSTILYFAEGREELSLKLNGQRIFKNIEIRSFDLLMQGLGILRADGRIIVQDFVSRVMNAWNTKPIKTNFTKEQVVRIERHISSIPFLNQK